MAFSTHIQQVLAYLKAGNKIQPPAGTVLPQAAPTAATLQGRMPSITPPSSPLGAK